jgi:chromosome segregation and condensation protein ScpB
MKIIRTADSEHSMKEQFETNLNCIIECATHLKNRNVSEEDLEGWTMDKISTSKDDINDVKRFYSDTEVDIDVHASNNDIVKIAQPIDPKMNTVINQVIKMTQVPKNKLMEITNALFNVLGDKYSISQIKSFIENSSEETAQQNTQQAAQQTSQQTSQQAQ